MNDDDFFRIATGITVVCSGVVTALLATINRDDLLLAGWALIASFYARREVKR